MSPIIFLMALTPVVKMMGKIDSPGFYINIPIPKSQDLPHCGATIQVLWEEDHTGTKRLVQIVVLKYNSKGDAELLYPNGTSEHQNLFTAKWKFTSHLKSTAASIYPFQISFQFLTNRPIQGRW